MPSHWVKILQGRQQSVTLHYQQNSTGWTDAVPNRRPNVHWPPGPTQFLQSSLLGHHPFDQAGCQKSGNCTGKIRLWRTSKEFFVIMKLCYQWYHFPTCAIFLGPGWSSVQKRRNPYRHFQGRRTVVDSSQFLRTNGFNSRSLHHRGKKEKYTLMGEKFETL